MTHRPRPIRLTSLVALAALTVMAACGSDTESPAATEPATVEGSTAPAADEQTADESATDASVADEPEQTVVSETSSITVSGDPLAPYDDPTADAAVGAIAPVVSGQDFSGNDMSIGGASDGPTMLVFLAHWCPHCNDEIPELNVLRDSGALPGDLDVIGISTAVAADRDHYPPSEWTVEKDWTWPMMADSEESEAIIAYGGTAFPFTVLLDADGTVLARRSGSAPAADISTWIAAALA